ncbi:response regulator [Vreelandella massiliensis]|uniref:response regulator n=1 Tax=Vreelandella massiliensis TaxID=1816686 RepID=UPI0009F91A16|nr:response regulator [Halomonas massiliensis]
MNQARKVLLVEDDQADAYITRRIFQEVAADIRLEHAETGESALAYLEANQQAGKDAFPALILLDLNMPRMDGFTFLQHAKQRPEFSPIPVVILTTSVSQSDIDRAYALGAAGYLVKPTGIDEFSQHIQQLTAYWFGLVRRPS